MIHPRLARIPAVRSFLAIAAAAAGLTGCGSSAVNFQARVPAAIDVGDIDRVAVADFDGLQQSGQMVAAKLTEGIVANGRFRMFERSKLDAILDERNFGKSEHVDPATAQKLKLAGVDALIFGMVDVYSVDDQTGVTKVETKIGTGEYETVKEKGKDGKVREVKKEILKTVMVDRGHVVRKGTMGVTFRMASVGTGQIVAIKSETVHFSEKCWDDETSRLPTKEMILESLSRDVASRFLGQIQPQYVVRSANFEKNDVPETEVGIKYAKAGLWDKAASTLHDVAAAVPALASAHYNVGLAYDALGRHGDAASSLERAINLEPKDKYIAMLAQVRRHAVESANLRAQERR